MTGWDDAVAFCNELSRKVGLTLFYVIDRTNIAGDFNNNSYRLPAEAEWECAARGGNISQGYKFSGSNNLNDVAWY